MTLLGEKECTIFDASLDSEARAQRSIRTRVRVYFSIWTTNSKLTNKPIFVKDGKKKNFNPRHVMWLATYGTLPLDGNLQYSHRCHNGNCVEPTHGVWENSVQNNQRNYCQTGSHVIYAEVRLFQ